MAWTYNDWPTQTTAAARLSRLREHITEVSAKISLETSSDGHSRSSSTLQTYLDSLFDHERRLEARTGEAASSYTAFRVRTG